MRFACDRCKTRYSIADERVRGKILKIRCKSCANVITVKEGMEMPAELAEASAPAISAAPAGAATGPGGASSAAATGQGDWPSSAPSAGAGRLGDRAQRSTTMAPQATVGSGGVAPMVPAPKPAPALGAAFASAMTAPQAPPQLEDEWYVSRDGEQQGPFGLHSAQAWVSQQPYDAELYCWCEGFDDWLPVDRIAHFRGLRARPLPVSPAAVAAPPTPARNERPLSGPLPRLANTPSRPATGVVPLVAPASAAAPAGAEAMAPAVEDQPQFAATMAALAGEGPSAGGVAAAPAAPTARALELPGWPSAHGPSTSSASTSSASTSSSSVGSPAASPGKGSGNGHGAARGFDAGDLGSQGFSADTGAASGRRASGSSSPVPIAPDAALSSPSMPAADDDLEFGEVSRVVRIADIGKTVRPPLGRSATAAASVRRTGANEVLPAALAAGLPGAPSATATPRPGSLPTASATGATPRLASTRATGAATALGGGLGGDGGRVEVPLVIPAKQRRNHALLLGLVAAGLIGAAVVALFVLQGSGDPHDPSLISISRSDVSDLTIRPDDPRPASKPSTGAGAGTAAEPGGPTARPTTGTGVKRPSTVGGGAIAVTPPGTGKVENTPAPSAGTPLGGDEVEEMSQRNSTGLQRCYEQALKKDIFLEVKSIKVTISINTSGVVSNVAMSSHADHALGQCMIARIRNWRFRSNSRGLDAKFTVAFGRT